MKNKPKIIIGSMALIILVIISYFTVVVVKARIDTPKIIVNALNSGKNTVKIKI